jgi:hypothetical protein
MPTPTGPAPGDQPKRSRYRIVIEAQPGTVPAIHRLRSWLKSGLRAFGLVAVSAVEVDAHGNPISQGGAQALPDDDHAEPAASH